MNDWKFAITLTICCGIYLAVASAASADYVGVTTVIKDDPETDFQCTQGNGAFVPGPLTVCNVSAAFDDPNNLLLSVGNADLQVYNGANPDVFFQHPLNFTAIAPLCSFITVFPDLICDTFVTIGLKCGPDSPDADGTYPDGDFDASEFAFNGHIVGGWFDSYPSEGQGVAGNYPGLQVLFVQSSVAEGLTLSGDIDIFWKESYPGGDVVAELDVPIECVAIGGCQSPEDCDDGDACTDDICSDGVCSNPTISCPNDGNECTDDVCDPDIGCVHIPNDNDCDDGDACTENDQCGDDGCVHGKPIDCDDGNECTEDACDPDVGCTNTPIGCSDGNPCTDDLCDPDMGCTHEAIECSKGQVCDPATGECVADLDPCECIDGKVTLCHVPPGNPGNAHTITIGCAARDRHLAHGDTCGPCE